MATGDVTSVILLVTKSCSCQLIEEKTEYVWVAHSSLIQDIIKPHVKTETECKLVVQSSPNAGDHGPWINIPDNLQVSFGTLFNLQPIKSIKVSHRREGSVSVNVQAEKEKEELRDFREVLGKKQSVPKRTKPSTGTKNELTNRDMLFNETVSLMDKYDVRFADIAEGKYVANVISSALWYITNQHMVINDASTRQKDVTCIPHWCEDFQGFNDVKRKKMKEQPMEAKDLWIHSQNLAAVSTRASLSKYADFQAMIKQLADCLANYRRYLLQCKQRSTHNQSLPHPVREVATSCFIQLHTSTESVGQIYQPLDEVIRQSPYNEPVLFDEAEHITVRDQFTNPYQRHQFRIKLHLSVPVESLYYCPGGSVTGIFFIWKVDINRSAAQEKQDTGRIVASLQPKLPVFHTRYMKRMFKERFSDLVGSKASVMEAIYKELTTDTSTPTNKEMQQRIQLMLQGEAGVIADLRKLNQGRPGTAFDLFFAKMEEVVNEVTATDDRRHGEVGHLSQWLSLRELVEQVKEICPDGTNIPSKACVRLQFAPRNKFTKRALEFTSRFQLQYKIQVRQLRAAHPDAHYCAAQFKYLRQRILMTKGNCEAVFVDDKAKIPIGKPGCPTSTGVRVRPSIVPSSSNLSALDHDIHALGNIIPTVFQFPEMPETVQGSWYRGQVAIDVHDAVFEQSDAYRYPATIIKMRRGSHGDTRPYHFKYSDGGTEHRTVLTKVQLGLIALFKILKLDMLVAARCAPNHSFTNPVERQMAILNIALQNCALEREACSEQIEGTLKNCQSMSDVRKAAERNPEIKSAWLKCTENVRSTVSSRFSRLKLKDEPFRILDSVSEDDVAEVIQCLQTMFPGIDPLTVTKAVAKQHHGLQEWMDKHCRLRQYVFQVKKCTDRECCEAARVEDLRWLPDPVLNADKEHFLSLLEVIDTQTTDADRPSNKKYQKPTEKSADQVDYFLVDELEEQKNDSSLLTAQHARMTVECVECFKPRVVYSRSKLTERQSVAVLMSLNEEYTCGARLLEPGHAMESSVKTRLTMTCGDPVELPYYSSKLGRPDLCSHCGSSGATVDDTLKRRFKTVLPMCQTCGSRGLLPLTARPYGQKKTK